MPSLLLPLERGRALPRVIGTGSILLMKETIIRLPTSAPMSLCQVNDHLTIGGQLLGPLVRDRDSQKGQEIKHPCKRVVHLPEFASTDRLTGAQFCKLQHKCRVVRHKLFHFHKLLFYNLLCSFGGSEGETITANGGRACAL